MSAIMAPPRLQFSRVLTANLTIRAMRWIVTDALPPAPLAQPLAQALQSANARTPQLLSDLSERFEAQVEPSPVQMFGCTPSERLLLDSLGCAISPNSGEQSAHPVKPLGASLAALHANVTDSCQTVWIAEMSSTIISPDRATLITLPWLQASPAHLRSLHEAARELLGSPGDPIWLEQIDAGRWRVHAEFPEHAWLASPGAVQGKDMGDWWPTETHWKTWRRLLNEIQMCWHEHPVNIERQQAGEPEINGLWLYGGGHGWTPRTGADVQWITTLTDAATRGDWQQWICDYKAVVEQLTEEIRVANSSGRDKVTQTSIDQSLEIVLTGQDRILRLTPRQHHWTRRWTQHPTARAVSNFLSRTEKPQPWSNWWNSV